MAANALIVMTMARLATFRTGSGSSSVIRSRQDAGDRAPDQEDAQVRGDDPSQQTPDALDGCGRILVARGLLDEGGGDGLDGGREGGWV
ncbi:hypothetical protein [Microbacterium elymi]|uniref:Uncharacterized protein n=1 Tax=Microbacterium elymi TaxID=2909587 RepID=A0ABY5NHP2_9MICO|nr:hypothetical protein [Microbacterium elymi]UUT34714.1 hypothetical protein L2X98_30050 [Microbacterium elymi]